MVPATLNLAVANVALPDIGKAFDASQTGLDLVAVGYSLGLAASVLYLGALGDRYGRKLMLLLGTGLAIPASLLAALAPSIGVPGRSRRSVRYWPARCSRALTGARCSWSRCHSRSWRSTWRGASSPPT